jgi:hypothetical protein
MWDLLFHPSIFFAGLWTAYWPILAGAIVVGGLLAIAYFSPLGKRYFLEAAVIVAIGLGVYQYGLHQADARCRAQNIAATKVINNVVNKAVKHTRTKKAVAAPDPWNSKDY